MAKEIQYIDLSRPRNDAQMQFHLYAVAICQEENPQRLGIVALFDAYKAAVEKEDDLFKRIEKSEFTEKIHDADHARDKVFSSVSAIVKTTVNHYNPDVVDAAKRLSIVLGNLGKNVNKKSYDEQTNAIYNLLQDLKGKYAEDVALIRITEMVNELERVNLEVEALIKQRMDESAHKNKDNMQELRGITDAHYNSIRKRINALVEVEGEENYVSFIDKMNVLIDRYKLLIAKSHHHEKKHDDPEENADGK